MHWLIIWNFEKGTSLLISNYADDMALNACFATMQVFMIWDLKLSLLSVVVSSNFSSADSTTLQKTYAFKDSFPIYKWFSKLCIDIPENLFLVTFT